MITSNTFEFVRDGLRNKYSKKIYIVDCILSSNVPQFPATSIVATNSVSEKYSTFDNIENVVSEEYEVNVYANDVEKKDEQTKEICNLICDLFNECGFVRTYEGLIDNLLDSSITRRVARFRKNNITKEN